MYRIQTMLVGCFLSVALLAHEFEVRYLHPPILQSHNWGKKILCHRPMRRGCPRMEIEQYGTTMVVHNYGHGGSGWTLAPGCVRYMVQEFTTRAHQEKIEHDAPLVVIGAGIMGLLTAYMLINAGYTHLTIIADAYDALASHHAGGFLAPSTIEIDAAMQPCIDAACQDAYSFYATIARGNHPDFPAHAVRIMPIYLKQHDKRLQAYEGTIMAYPSDVIIDFGNGKRYPMKVYDDGIFIDTDCIMERLHTLLEGKVTFKQEHVSTYDEIQVACIFNCTGLGAQQIAHDDAMVSVQGHLILLEHQEVAHMDYMISFYVDPGITHDGIPVKRSIYMFPKHALGAPDNAVGVMGGVFIEDATQATPHDEEFDLLIARAREFFGT